MSPEELLAQFGEQQVAGFILVLARVSPLFVLAPLFSSKMVPARARSIVAVGLAIGIAPIAATRAAASRSRWTSGCSPAWSLKELLVGLAFSFALAALFAAIQVAGSMLDTLIGFSFGALVDPITGTNGGVLNQLYALIGAMIFVVINGDAWVIQGLARTYEAIPLTDAPRHGLARRGRPGRVHRHLRRRRRGRRPGDARRAAQRRRRSASSRASCRSSTSSPSASRPRSTVGLVMVGASLPFVAGWLGDELQSSVSAALQHAEGGGLDG